jgi:hypothetical protein
MAAMAEALVELTALRRKVDSHLESVGGPTDVAVISKGDGFIWVKLKALFQGGNESRLHTQEERCEGDDK